MKKHPIYVILVASAALTTSACGADESAPNRRGIERPPLFGGVNAQQNAEKRETETPSNTKSAPNVNGEFPGQSRLDMGSDRVLMLDDVGTAATTPAAVGTATTEAASEVAATAAAPAATLPQPQVRGDWRDEKKPYAVPGKTMIVPDTGGEAIPASWGEPVVLKSYPHRPYSDKKVTYMSGETLHNPVYYHSLYAPDQIPPENGFDGGSHFSQPTSVAGGNGLLSGPGATGNGSAAGNTGTAGNANAGANAGTSTANSGVTGTNEPGMGGAIGAGGGNGAPSLYDVANYPWFYAETLALPVFMVMHSPWSQKSTSWNGHDPLYAGGLPATGNIVPAPYPGEIRYTYEFSTGRPNYDNLSSSPTGK